MSQGLICDQCGTMLTVDNRGESETGEEAAWLTISLTWASYDLCSRACAGALLDDDDFVALHDAELEAIVGVVRTINDASEREDQSDV